MNAPLSNCERGDETWLLGRLRRGDEEAFDVVYDRYRPRVFSFLCRLSADRFLAEDLVQETFLRLANKARDLHPTTNLRAWLFTVARNLCVDQRRHVHRGLGYLHELSLLPRRTPRSPSERAELSESVTRLEQALRSLSETHREVLLLCGVEDFTPAEAAEVLDLAPATLRKRLSRARVKLKEALDVR
ncbi:MAG: RNA polymerase sigma factor [Myxococcota bacterium]